MSIKETLARIFQEEFDDDSLKISEEMNSDDIEDWDSLANINLLVAMEKEFDIKFSMKDIQNLENIGDMINLIEKLKN
jgi:acyl carrier protein